jgi:hypothetical protein
MALAVSCRVCLLSACARSGAHILSPTPVEETKKKGAEAARGPGPKAKKRDEVAGSARIG